MRAITKVSERVITKTQAAKELGISRVHFYRLWDAHARAGVGGIVSKRRGLPGNRRYPDEFRRHVIGILKAEYPDFGPTLAGEKLAEKHGIVLGTETLRRWMSADGMWLCRAKRRAKARQPRLRRECFGELVQVDGCQHWWFEDRGPKCYLLVFIDDATGAIGRLHFAETESAFA
ncbi:MAG: hypothetical protein ACR2P5_01955 [Gammaproteobacteria bacterium]